MGSTSPSWLARRAVLAEPYSSEFDVTISDTAMPAPSFLQSWRKGRSVTPAMGATIRRFLRRWRPIRIGGGFYPRRVPRPSLENLHRGGLDAVGAATIN